MYEQFFEMTHTPFTRDVPPEALYESPAMRDALGRLAYVADRQLFAVVTADAGCGKSTLIRKFASSLPKEKYILLYLSDSKLTPRWFYRGCLDQLGLEARFYRGDAKRQLQKEIEIVRGIQHKYVVCILDEAHLLEKEMLEEFRFLLNYRFDSMSPMALVLAGQTELWENKLRLQRYAAIRQRIDINCVLPHLDRSETEQYIQSHLSYAGCNRDVFSDKALEKLILAYTREAGVRELERKIGKICRKVAAQLLKKETKAVRITIHNLPEYLGKEKFQPEKRAKKADVGIVRGLAWTSVGGVTLEIEVNEMPGKGEIKLTGQLGDVMKESAMTGISYIRSVSRKYDIPDDYFETHDLHIHIPEGAVPKDGPSAGITMAAAVLSAIIHRKIRANLAMTGEITLRGRVLPIGGLKEKLLAAKNAGIENVLIPVDNVKDLEEIEQEIKTGLNIAPVTNMEEVLQHSFQKESKDDY